MISISLFFITWLLVKVESAKFPRSKVAVFSFEINKDLFLDSFFETIKLNFTH